MCEVTKTNNVCEGIWGVFDHCLGGRRKKRTQALSHCKINLMFDEMKLKIAPVPLVFSCAATLYPTLFFLFFFFFLFCPSMVCGMQDCGSAGGQWGTDRARRAREPPNQIKIENPYQTKPKENKLKQNSAL